jgi:hypothetical protein
MFIYVWVLLAAVALVLFVWCGLIAIWALVLRRMAQSGIRSWDASSSPRMPNSRMSDTPRGVRTSPTTSRQRLAFYCPACAERGFGD